jgi:hypothetical protein
MSDQIRLCCADCSCTTAHSSQPVGPNGEWITVPEGPNVPIASEEEPTSEETPA